MAFDHIYDLYNQSLQEDEPKVQEAVDEIKTEISRRVEAKEEFVFLYDIADKFAVEPLYVQLRLRDQIQYIMRNIGIQCSCGTDSLVLTIRWFLRDKREFMKSYY